MPKYCKQIHEMISMGRIDPIPNTFIDAYNHIQRAGITGAIRCNVDTSNLNFVTVKVSKKHMQIGKHLMLTDKDGCCLCLLNSLARGGWTIQNMVSNRYHKPGVYIVCKKCKK